MVDYGLISVIIPVYNVEQYLRECIDSVLKQTYKNFEIILIDDGSTDKSGEICDEYVTKDKRVSVIHKENGGLSVARNTGFSLAKGDYIFFLDSDDWILEETLEELITKARKENVDFIFFDSASFIDGDESIQIEQRYVRKNNYKPDSGKNMFVQLQINKDYHSAVQMYFYKAEFLKKADVSFYPGILYEDMLYTFEMFYKADKVAHLSKVLYQRRYRSGSIMTSKKKKKNFDSAAVVYHKVKDVSDKLDIIDDESSKTYIVRCAFNALNMYKDLSSQERAECKSDYKKLKQDILQNKAFGSKALHMRCYGVFPWFCYKVYEKTFRKLLKGRN